jgi:phosphoglucosamine mutase
MGKYFGTDGVRGVANQELTPLMAFRIGLALGHLFPSQKIVCGRDTRLSGDMLQHALAAGICSSSADVYDVGVVSTPVIAHLSVHEDFACGVMISASHNPFEDNGIKIFNHQGVKIDDATEAIIETIMEGAPIDVASPERLGRSYAYREGLTHYLNHLKQLFDFDLSDVKIAIDVGHGSATQTAIDVLTHFKAQLSVLNNAPDGLNINTQCGSTHPEGLQAFVREQGCDVGLAFDGDADRLIAVDAQGRLVDGDALLYILATHLNAQGQLKGQTVVSTVMSNLGFHKALKRQGLNSEITQVGDKYVYDRMLSGPFDLGGEQSGHIIFRQHATTGDGLLSALMVLKVMVHTQQSLAELRKDLVIYPQTLKNVKVKDKKQLMHNPELQRAIETIERELAGDGRILVRPSGTEPLVRVMVEAPTQAACDDLVNRVIDVVHSLEASA